MPDLLIDFGAITVPQPEPYDNNRAEKQRENLAYVVNQILQQMNQNNIQLEIPESVGVQPSGSLQELTEAVQDLQFNGYTIKIGPLEITLHGQTGLLDISEA